jgi:hypothetical protein
MVMARLEINTTKDRMSALVSSKRVVGLDGGKLLFDAVIAERKLKIS